MHRLIIFSVLLVPLPALMPPYTDLQQTDGGSDLTGVFGAQRLQRGIRPVVFIGAVGVAMVKGMHATGALLKGAKQLPSAGKFEEVYVKVGSYGHAKLDFFSVLNLRNIDVTADALIGHVGDRIVTLLPGNAIKTKVPTKVKANANIVIFKKGKNNNGGLDDNKILIKYQDAVN